MQPGLPCLALLCASPIDLASGWTELAAVRGELEAIASDPNFGMARRKLQCQLSAGDTGFVAVQRISRTRLAAIYTDPATARTLAGASPTFLASAPPVGRPELLVSGQNWWASPQQVRVQLGLEGMGKTWSALELMRDLSASDGGPIPVIITSKRAEHAPDGLAAVLDGLVALGEHAGLHLSDPRGFWQRRLRLWAHPAAGSDPKLLILVDGLDELDPFDWEGWLAPLFALEWRSLFRLIITCRDDDWVRRVRAASVLPRDTAPVSVGRFGTAERDVYLSARGINTTVVSEQVLEAALHPRTAFHLTRLAAEIGDLKRITREQLLLRDFANRHMLKGGELDGDGFMALVSAQAQAAQAAALAQQAYRVTQGAIVELAAEISGYDRNRMRSVLGDLIGASWFERDSSKPHLLTFKDTALPDAVGFALADKIRGLSVADAVVEIDRFLEPWNADDLVEKVLRTCATALVVDSAVEDALCMAVLERWEEKPFHGDAGQDFWRRLHIFRPTLFLDLCGRHGSFDGSWLLPWGIACLWDDHPSARGEVEQHISRWLSVVPLSDDRDSGDRSYNRVVNRERRKQRRRLRALEKIQPGQWAPRIGVPTSDWPQGTVRLASRIVGFLPRLSFVPAIAAWAENHAAAGHGGNEREILALLRYNELDHTETLTAVRTEAHRLQALDTDLGRTAAAMLLRSTSEPDDAASAETLKAGPTKRLPSYLTRGRDRGSNRICFVLDRTPPSGQALLRELSAYAADPWSHLDPAVAAALEGAVANLNAKDVPTLFEFNGQALATVLRWHPERFDALYRAYLRANRAGARTDGSGNPDQVNRDHALHALPFFEESELTSLADRLAVSANSNHAGRDFTDAFRLAHRPLSEQVALLIAAPMTEWPQNYKHLLNEPEGSEIADLITGIDFKQARDDIWPDLTLADTLVRRFGAGCTPIERDWRIGLGHGDEDVRRRVISLATHVAPAAAALELVALSGPGALTVSGRLPFEESAPLLALDDETLRRFLPRLHPEVLMRAYQRRPNLRTDISGPLRAWMADKLLVKRSSRALGNAFMQYVDRDEAYAEFCRVEHAEAVRLIRSAWGDKHFRDNILWEHGGGPAWAMIKALATSEIQLVKEIWRGSLDETSSIWVGDVEIFPATLPVGETFDDLRAEMLHRALTDERLFVAVISLERAGHGAFLRDWVRARLDGGRALDRARALAVAGFLDGTDEAIALWAEIEASPVPAGWLGDVRTTARKWFNRALAARHWYREMSSATSEFSAYRCFWLASRHFDDRYELYFRAPGLRVDRNSWRAQWLDFFGDMIKNFRSNADKDLKKSFAFDKRANDIIHGA